MLSRSILAACLACLVVACGGEEAPEEGAQSTPKSVIPENAPDPFARPDASSGPFPSSLRTACESMKNMTAPLCACVDELAQKRLDQASRDFLTAQLGKDTRRAAELRKTLTSQQMTKAGTFMGKAIAECGGRS